MWEIWNNKIHGSIICTTFFLLSSMWEASCSVYSRKQKQKQAATLFCVYTLTFLNKKRMPCTWRKYFLPVFARSNKWEVWLCFWFGNYMVWEILRKKHSLGFILGREVYNVWLSRHFPLFWRKECHIFCVWQTTWAFGLLMKINHKDYT